MITAKYLYEKELSKFWITEYEMYQASIILNSAFWKEYFIDLENRLLNNNKGWTIKFFNLSLLYRFLAVPTLENNLWLLRLSEILKTFSKNKSIFEYIKRLKDDNLSYAALFELLVAFELHKNWFKVELQKLNYSNNPIEIYFENNWVSFWIECKSYKFKIVEENYSQKIIRKINYLIDKLPKYIAVNITINFVPKSEVEIKNIISLCIKELSSYTSQKWDYITINSFWKIEFKTYTENNIQETFDSIYVNSEDVYCKSQAPKHKYYINLPDVEYLDNKYINIIWISCDEKIEKILFNDINDDWFLKDVKNKVLQQKNIIERWDEVIIIFDKNAYKINNFDNIKTECLKTYSKYQNLTLLIWEFEPNLTSWKLEGKLLCIYASNNFINLYIFD